MSVQQQNLEWDPEATQSLDKLCKEHEIRLRRLAEADCLRSVSSVLTAQNVEQARLETRQAYPQVYFIIIIDVIGTVLVGLGVNYVTAAPPKDATPPTHWLPPQMVVLAVGILVLLLGKILLRFPRVLRWD